MAEHGMARAKAEFRWEEAQRALLAAYDAAVAPRVPAGKPKDVTT
jgi:hypothetical protein